MLSTFRTAKTIGDLAGWKISNLPIQKLMYLAHMYHLGRKGAPLVDGRFEAWDLGPVQPEVYRKLKAYGSGDVSDVFGVPAFAPSSDEYATINEVYEALKSASPGRLVSITHWKHGAWASHYASNVKGIVIPDEDIRAEYERRARGEHKH